MAAEKKEFPMSKSVWIEAKAKEINEFIRDYKTSLEKATALWDVREIAPLKKPLKK